MVGERAGVVMEFLVLKKDNIHEIAKRTGKDPNELEVQYYFALARNEFIVFAVETVEWRFERGSAPGVS